MHTASRNNEDIESPNESLSSGPHRAANAWTNLPQQCETLTSACWFQIYGGHPHALCDAPQIDLHVSPHNVLECGRARPANRITRRLYAGSLRRWNGETAIRSIHEHVNLQDKANAIRKLQIRATQHKRMATELLGTIATILCHPVTKWRHPINPPRLLRYPQGIPKDSLGNPTETPTWPGNSQTPWIQ